MRRHVSKALVLVVAILLAGAAADGPQAGPDLIVTGYETQGKTVRVSVTNPTGSALRGSILATVERDGVSHKASARTKVAAGQSVTVSIIVGTITDDLNPLDQIFLGTITEDIDPW